MALAAEAARPARRHARSIAATNTPPPTSASRDHRAGQHGAGGARGGGEAARSQRGKPTIPVTIGEEKAGQSVPARRRAGGRRRHRHGRQAGGAGVRGNPRAEEQVLEYDALRLTAADIIRLLDLKPHPEGGHYRETFRDTRIDRRPRRLDRDLFPAGARRALALAPRRRGRDLALLRRRAAQARNRRRQPKDEIVRLGADIHAGEVPQVTVPARAWQAAESFGDWTLVGCTVAPGFDFNGFELAPTGWSPAQAGILSVTAAFFCQSPACRSGAANRWRRHRQWRPRTAPQSDTSACWRHWSPAPPGA